MEKGIRKLGKLRRNSRTHISLSWHESVNVALDKRMEHPIQIKRKILFKAEPQFILQRSISQELLEIYE